MNVITKIALLISTLLILNGCTEADIRALNNALNGYNGTSYGQSYQRPSYVQPSFPKTQTCRVMRNPLNPSLSTVTCY